MPTVRVFHNANQSITTATNTALAFNSERYDQAANAADTMHDNVTNNSRLICKYAGVYSIKANVEWAAAAGGERIIDIRLNGVTTIARCRENGTNTNQNQIITCDYSLAVNDYVEAVVFQNSGAGLNINVVGNYS